MLRDQLKTEEYFHNFIAREENRINRFSECLSDGKVAQKQIQTVKESIWICKFQKLIAKYSLGVPISELCYEYEKLIENGIISDWSVGYFEPVATISLGILLHADEKYMSIIKDHLRQAEQKEWLFDFLLSYGEKPAYLPKDGVFPMPFYLRLCNALNNDEDAIVAIRNYLSDWYRCQSYEYWYGNDKSDSDTYFGYWSFEAGALAAILGVDPEQLKDKKYFPKDLVDYYNQNK